MNALKHVGNRWWIFSSMMALALTPFAGCDGLGGDPVILPFGQITAVQLFEETNYTVALSTESAVLNPSAVARVNWVFGDGSGFVEGPTNRATMTHRYSAPGDYDVTAYIFGASGLVDTITTTITVLQNDDGSGPNPNPSPEDLPGAVSAPFPADDASQVSTTVELRWTSGILTDTFDVYFGTDETAVAEATNSDASFKGNQDASRYEPAELDPETDYYWRIDGINDLGKTTGEVFHFKTAAAPAKAKNPSPGNGSAVARFDAVLQWTAGARATSHDVYFGKDAQAVGNATTEDGDIFQENLTVTQFDPEDVDADEAGALLPDTEYFWRIDSVGVGGTVKGDVWSFRTAMLPPKATSPVPGDGSANVSVDQVLTWVGAPEIERFDVFLGTDLADVAEAERGSPSFQQTVVSPTFDPTDLKGSKTYYWRVDSLGAGGTTRGDVFSFSTIAPPAAVTGPFTPANDASSVTINPTLEWNVGGGGPTIQFRVYLGEDEGAIVARNANTLKSTQDVSFDTFEIVEASSLKPDTRYFWTVDAHGPGGVATGQPVLSFTTGTKPSAASGPNPANNKKGVALDVTLQWAAATGADSYDVYFGTTQADVDNAGDDDAAFQATVNGTSHALGELMGNTQYFWRIDSRGPGGTTKGAVWRFTTAPERASVPAPFDGEEDVDRDVTLTWTSGAGATSHDVYLGTDENAVQAATRSSAGIFRGSQTATSFTPNADLLGDTKYYWRIDEVNADGTSIGRVWQFTTIAGQAIDPVPADGATGVSLTPSLDWTPDATAVSHDVYFGTTADAVQQATTADAEFQGNFILGGGTPPFQPPTVLDGLTFYFWRVDTVSATGTTKGEVWRFRTGPGKASEPVPANFATSIATSSTLMWTAGVGAVTHDVYIGTSQSDVHNSTISTLLGTTQRVNVGVTEILPPISLATGTTYYWRVDSVAANNQTRTKGDVWRFTTSAALELPAQASGPMPFSTATNVALNVTLNWGAADRATSYDVYFGTSMVVVQNATTASPEFQGNQSSRSYQPSGLTANTTYYWRIDSVNATGKTTGAVWSFTTAP